MRTLKKFVLSVSACFVSFVFLFLLLPRFSFKASAADVDVENSASFSTDVIYQIVTDRFRDGDPTNNPTGSIYDDSQWASSSRNNRLYQDQKSVV